MIIFILLLLTLIPVSANALEPQTAGYAGVHHLGVKDPSVLEWNPALLTPHRGYRSSIELPSVGGGILNNAISIEYWNDHLAGDRYLTAADKEDILDRIPDDGLRVDAHANVPIAGFTRDQWGARVAVRTANTATLPHEFAELALNSYTLNRLYEIGKPRIEHLAFFDAAAGFGYKFEQDYVPDLNFGIGFHYYRGFNLIKLKDGAGELLVTDSTISGSANYHMVESNSGDGVGFDLGIHAMLSKKWEVGLAFRQLGARIAWEIDDNEVVSMWADSAGPMPDSISHEGYWENWTHYGKANYAGGRVETPLPVIIQMNALYYAKRNWTVVGDAQITTRETAFGKAGIQIGAATEYRPTNFLPLYGGISIGGPWRIQSGIGSGLRFRNYELDLGWTWTGMFSDGQGWGMGMAHRIKF